MDLLEEKEEFPQSGPEHPATSFLNHDTFNLIRTGQLFRFRQDFMLQSS